MKNTFVLSILFITTSLFQCCSNSSDHEGIDPFYTTKSFGDIPLIPLLKPLKLSLDKITNDWWIEIPFSFKHQMLIDSLSEIGVEKTFVYGKINKKTTYIENYKNGFYVLVDKFNIVYYDGEELIASSDEKRIYPTDSIHKNFILPERWFILNVNDSTLEAFFDKSKYQDYLTKKGVSGKLYSIDTIDKQFVNTGILPWFPDHIKDKLRK